MYLRREIFDSSRIESFDLMLEEEQRSREIFRLSFHICTARSIRTYFILEGSYREIETPKWDSKFGAVEWWIIMALSILWMLSSVHSDLNWIRPLRMVERVSYTFLVEESDTCFSWKSKTKGRGFGADTSMGIGLTNEGFVRVIEPSMTAGVLLFYTSVPLFLHMYGRSTLAYRFQFYTISNRVVWYFL